MRKASSSVADLDFLPLFDNILLRPLMPDERAGDMVAPHAAHAHAAWGEVVAIGSRAREAGAHPVLKGDRVAFRPANAVEIALAGQWFAVVAAADLLGVAARPSQQPRASPPVAAEADIEMAAAQADGGREELLETDVAPDVLDRSEPTAEDLH